VISNEVLLSRRLRWLRDAGFGIRKVLVPKKDIATELKTTVWTMRNLFRKYNIDVRVNRNPNGKSKSNKVKELQIVAQN